MRLRIFFKCRILAKIAPPPPRLAGLSAAGPQPTQFEFLPERMGQDLSDAQRTRWRFGTPADGA